MEKRITVTIASRGHEGNIYAILGKVRTEMRKRQLIQAYNDLRDGVLNSESYTDAIARIRQDINLVDSDGAI